MIALIEKAEKGYIARFERELKYSVEEVWSWLTDNDKLPLWFSELRVDELCIGGVIKFDMRDGTFIDMKILDLKENVVLEYTWGEDIVRFELLQHKEGCQLVLIEKIKTITSHTPRDLAGWHVCLDVIEALLNGKTIAREEEWKKWFGKYQDAVVRVQS